MDVTHPESLAFHPRHGRTAVVVRPDGGCKAIDLNLVTALQIDNGRSETTELASVRSVKP